jgi:glycosyltransferase involved in cell wall biosynthesis
MLQDLAKELADRGCQILVLTGDAEYTDDGRVAAYDHDPSIKRLWTARGATRVLSWSLFWLQAVLLIPFMSWDRCVILTDPPFVAVAARLAKWLNHQRRVFWWTMDLYPEALTADGLVAPGGLAEKALRKANEFSLKGLDGVVTLGPMQKARLQTYKNFSADPSFCIMVPPWDHRHVPLPPAGNNRVIQAFGWDGKKVALYAGNLGRGHSYDDLIEAATILAVEDDRWVLAFFCRGAGRVKLELAAKGLPNVLINDYVPPDMTADLLHAADVHLITMEDGWEGVVVPSKLYAILKTSAPVLFVGPSKSDSAYEILSLRAGKVLPNGCGGRAVASALNELAVAGRREILAMNSPGPKDIALFILK